MKAREFAEQLLINGEAEVSVIDEWNETPMEILRIEHPGPLRVVLVVAEQREDG